MQILAGPARGSSLISSRQTVDVSDLWQSRVPRVPPLDRHVRGLGESLSSFGIIEQVTDHAPDFLRFGSHEGTVRGVKDLWNATDARANHTESQGHRLQEGRRKSLLPRNVTV